MATHGNIRDQQLLRIDREECLRRKEKIRSIETGDDTIQGIEVSMHHTKSITIPQYITAN